MGTPKGKIQQYEKKWLDLPWQQVRESVEVKLFEQDGELYVLAKSAGRRAKETAMRRQRLARLLKKLRAMRRNLPSRDQLLMRLGAAKSAAGRAFPFVHQNSQPMSQGTYSASNFIRSRTIRAASMTSLPTPSPGIHAIRYLAIGR